MRIKVNIQLRKMGIKFKTDHKLEQLLLANPYSNESYPIEPILFTPMQLWGQ